MRSTSTFDNLKREMLPVIQRLPAYTRLAWALIREPKVGRRKAVLLGGLAYLLSPIDFVPGVVPGLGQLDDLAVVLFALKTALAGLPRELSRGHLVAAGLPEDALDEDLARVGRSARIIAKAGLRFGLRLIVAARKRLAKLGRRQAVARPSGAQKTIESTTVTSRREGQ